MKCINFDKTNLPASTKNEITLNDEEINNYTGTYYDSGNNEFTISTTGSNLYLIYQNQNPIKNY